MHMHVNHASSHITSISTAHPFPSPAFRQTRSQRASVSTATRSPPQRILDPPHECHVASAQSTCMPHGFGWSCSCMPHHQHCTRSSVHEALMVASSVPSVPVDALIAPRCRTTSPPSRHHSCMSLLPSTHACTRTARACMYSCVRATTHSRRGLQACRSSLYGIQGPGSRAALATVVGPSRAQSSQMPAALLLFLPPLLPLKRRRGEDGTGSGGAPLTYSTARWNPPP